jgi:hypothetical protein
LRAALIERYDWTRNRFVIGEYRSGDTIKESLDLEKKTRNQGLLLDNGIGKHVLHLKGKEQ